MNKIPLLTNKRIVLGVTGSIAAYKAIDLASKLTQAGALVDVIMTEAAQRFVTPLSFQSVSGRTAHPASNLWGSQAHVVHIGLAEGAELLVIAPCTADTLARLAHGRANDLLAVTALAARCPLLVAPAMDGGMWSNPATQANIDTLRARGVTIIGPAEGRMASGLLGKGRLVEPAELLGHIRLALGRGGPLAGRQVVVSAGGTQEPIDPVRYISNHSSGKQGFAVAQAALDAGASVTLVTAPAALPTPVGAQRVEVRSAEQMLAAVLEATAEADALVMAAAVADFRPATRAGQKIKRAKTAELSIPLVHNPDILLAVAERKARSGKPDVLVGFAAESQNLIENARDKLARKRLAFIVANDITATDAGFWVDDNRVSIIDAGGEVVVLPLLSKAAVAVAVVARLVTALELG